MQKSYQNNKESSENRALDRFAEMLMEKIKNIQSDWKKPWFTEGALAWPKNLSGRNYNGLNSLMLLMHCEEEGYKIPVFATFDRISSLNFAKNKEGGFVPILGEDNNPLPKVTINRGEKSFPVFMTSFTCVDAETKEKISYQDYKDLTEEEKSKYNVYPKLHVYNVFNIAAQTNLSEARPEMYKKISDEYLHPEKKREELSSFEPIDKMIEQQSWICPIKPMHGDNAYYSISKKIIVIPEKEQFRNGESFYGTLFHEMTHSTGAEEHLDRLKPTSFGSAEYAREELVAEIVAALVSQKYGMTKYVKEDSLPYLKGWLDTLKEDPSYIKTLLNDVKKASHMMTQKIDEVQLQLDKGVDEQKTELKDSNKQLGGSTKATQNETIAAKTIVSQSEMESAPIPIPHRLHR